MVLTRISSIFLCELGLFISYPKEKKRLISMPAITCLFLKFALIMMVCISENILVLISKECPYFDLCPYCCFILEVEVLLPGT